MRTAQEAVISPPGRRRRRDVVKDGRADREDLSRTDSGRNRDFGPRRRRVRRL